MLGFAVWFFEEERSRKARSGVFVCCFSSLHNVCDSCCCYLYCSPFLFSAAATLDAEDHSRQLKRDVLSLVPPRPALHPHEGYLQGKQAVIDRSNFRSNFIEEERDPMTPQVETVLLTDGSCTGSFNKLESRFRIRRISVQDLETNLHRRVRGSDVHCCFYSTIVGTLYPPADHLMNRRDFVPHLVHSTMALVKGHSSERQLPAQDNIAAR